jgi:hypothetical protein
MTGVDEPMDDFDVALERVRDAAAEAWRMGVRIEAIEAAAWAGARRAAKEQGAWPKVQSEMTDDLVAFLRARLDDDERNAIWDREQREEDPRAFREVEAKRRIVDAYEWAAAHPHTDDETGFWVRKGETSALRDTVIELAVPYADHPDYRPEWENAVSSP